MVRTVLVVGATGVLAPAADALRARGDEVVAVSRSGSGDSLAVDARDAAGLRAALVDRTWTDALVYGPAVGGQSLSYLRAATPGRVVHIRASADADPVLGVLIVPAGVLQLGWVASSPPRWHTAEEISEASLAALDAGDAGESHTLGVVRPWSDRP